MIDVADHLRVRNLITDYVWKLDMADIEGVLDLFRPDGIFEDTAGNVYKGREQIGGYFNMLVNLPAFRGRQHHIDNLRIEPHGTGCSVRSYWTVTKWRTAENQVKLIESLGHSLDILERRGDGFIFAERRVHHWRDADCPWGPDGTAV